MNLQSLIEMAYSEDIPSGDVTTESLKIDSYPGKAHLIAKEDLVLSGIKVFNQCLTMQSPQAHLKWYYSDGDFVLKGQTLCIIEANLVEVIKAERVALNFLGHLSGIASLTKCFVKEVDGSKCKILDTRKTTPLMRNLEKQAVLHGGGSNHRLSLSSAILIKENHIEIAGGISQAIEKIKQCTQMPIEIEVKTIEEVKMALQHNVQRLMLDNMSDEEIADCMNLIPAHIEVEASGNMTVDRVKSVAQLGVNYISVGALTHSAPCADISLVFQW